MGRLTMHHAHCPAVRERETVIPDPFLPPHSRSGPGHEGPGSAGWTQVRRSAATHGDAGPLELLADRAPMNAQLGTDLAQA